MSSGGRQDGAGAIGRPAGRGATPQGWVGVGGWRRWVEAALQA